MKSWDQQDTTEELGENEKKPEDLSTVAALVKNTITGNFLGANNVAFDMEY